MSISFSRKRSIHQYNQDNRDDYRYPMWAHPDVMENCVDWQIIRDCLAGQRRIKERGELYLPRLDEQDEAEYLAFLDRAVFYNMTARTVNAMAGMIFRRRPVIEGLNDRYKTLLQDASVLTGESFDSFVKLAVTEALSMGRYGVLVDMDGNGKGLPYFAGYRTEDILDWREAKVDGRVITTAVCLRSLQVTQQSIGKPRRIFYEYRVLELVVEGREDDEVFSLSPGDTYYYRQRVYIADSVDADLTRIPFTVQVPTRRGVRFKTIPFYWLGACTTGASVDKSAILAIAELNLAHYKSYALLEHGRYYTAMPVWYAQNVDGSNRDYRIGSSVVWNCAPGERPGIIEFNGSGLKFLESACLMKEEQIAQIGGRLLGGYARSVSESDNQTKTKEANERTTLLDVVLVANQVFTQSIRFWRFWADGPEVDQMDVSISLNTEFLWDTLGARELRAVYQMYKDGVLPIDILHAYLQKAEVIPDWCDAELFREMLSDPEQFINNPDALAKMRGFPDKEAWLRHRRELRKIRTGEAEQRIDALRAKVQAAEKGLDASAAAGSERITDATVTVDDKLLPNSAATQSSTNSGDQSDSE